MSVHYLKKEVTKYICSLLRIIKLARQSFFNRNNIAYLITYVYEIQPIYEHLFFDGPENEHNDLLFLMK